MRVCVWLPLLAIDRRVWELPRIVVESDAILSHTQARATAANLHISAPRGGVVIKVNYLIKKKGKKKEKPRTD